MDNFRWYNCFYRYIAHFYKTTDATTKLGVFATIPAIRNPIANLITEIYWYFYFSMGFINY